MQPVQPSEHPIHCSACLCPSHLAAIPAHSEGRQTLIRKIKHSELKLSLHHNSQQHGGGGGTIYLLTLFTACAIRRIRYDPAETSLPSQGIADLACETQPGINSPFIVLAAIIYRAS